MEDKKMNRLGDRQVNSDHDFVPVDLLSGDHEEFCLHEFVEAQAKRTPDGQALRFGTDVLTYRDLDELANQRAHYLRELGVGPDVIVAVVMERSLEIVVALLSVLKAGGAYLPIDPAYPAARLDFMLADADAALLITQERFAGVAAAFQGTVLTLDRDLVGLGGYPRTAPAPWAKPDHLAYVLYTSGSTGRPKGCMLSHRAVGNRLTWMQDAYRLTPADRVLQKTPYTFDVSMWEFFWPLMTGAVLVLAQPKGHQDTGYLVKTICTEGITVCHFVPSMLRMFLADSQARECTTLRQVFVSGEALPFDLLGTFKASLPAQLHNLYGPTEAAIDVTYWAAEERADGKVPIGRPIRNVRLYVLDDEGRQVPAGEAGELHIAGVALARGYLNRPDLTAQRFVERPLAAPNERMYRTGDLVRELADGNIEFLGRRDFQVKLRGLRIELGEIEATLREHASIAEAVVLVKGQDESDPKLVAYLQPKQPGLTAKQVRAFVGERLPVYMVPNVVALVDQWPVTAHGKLDRDALAWPVQTDEHVHHGATGAPATAPAAPNVTAPFVDEAGILGWLTQEAALALKLKDVPPHADLFDLGATSLAMVGVVTKVREHWGVSVPVEVFLDTPTLAAVAAYIAGRKAASPPAAEPVDATKADTAPASAAAPLALPAVRFRASAYLSGAKPAKTSTAQPIELPRLGAWLGALCAGIGSDEPRYLYPSAGGVNAVRTYLLVKPDAIGGLPAGVFYLHPYKAELLLVAPWSDVIAGSFSSYDKPAFEAAAFAVFFVAAMDAIEPVYQGASRSLVTLEAGYMSQLLLSRQSRQGLLVTPAASVGADLVRQVCSLEADERFIHCLLGAQEISPGVGALVATSVGKGFLETLGVAATQAGRRGPAAHAPATPALPAEIELPLATENRSGEGHLHPRRLAGDIKSFRLEGDVFPWDEYSLRSTCREYDTAPVAIASLSALLAISRQCFQLSAPSYLYGSVGGRRSLQLMLQVGDGRVDGLEEGLYRYAPDRHELVPVGPLPGAVLGKAFTPFNRKHFRQAAFCLFVLGAPAAELGDSEALDLMLLEAGYLGQVLMERQAEFGIGLCPIGGLMFDRLRPAFHIEERQVLLHSFTGGGHRRAIPSGHAGLVEKKPAAVASERGRSVAIVGISGRYPGAPTSDDLWALLQDGGQAIAELPVGRKSLLSAEQEGSLRPGGFLKDIDCFDNLLFNVSPMEARALDPQERLLLEGAWHCLENAGYTAARLSSADQRVGVFVGAMWNDYQSHGVESWLRKGAVEEFSHHASLANRISHFFNFSGPSVAMNTSCSSAMSALHFACESIVGGECDVALVGAANLVSHLYHARLLEQLNFLSKEPLCRPFSAQANGWVLGEGVGAVLLKPLEQAERDGDHIHGVIRSTALGHSGRSARFGTPSARQQANAMQRALSRAGLQPRDIGYVEAAAPGAMLADASEFDAIRAVFGVDGEETLCRFGSIKANVGHLESASGMAQLAKVLLQFRHGEMTPSLNARPLSPMLSIEGSGLALVEERTPWAAFDAEGRQLPRRAMINVLGAAGSSGHLVVEEFHAAPRSEDTAGPVVIPLSAASQAQLLVQLTQLQRHLAASPDVRLVDMAFTLQTGRVAMKHRVAMVVDSLEALRQLLSDAVQGAQGRPHLHWGTVDAEPAVPTRPESTPSSPQATALAWVLGQPLEWPRLHRDGAQRLPLPGYPFARVSHWIYAGEESAPRAVLIPVAAAAVPQVLPSGRRQELIDRAGAYFVRILADAVGCPSSQIDLDASFEALGLSSLMVHAMNAKLQTLYGDLPSTLLFEYRTLRLLVTHLVELRPQVTAEFLGLPWTDSPAALPLAPHAVRTPVLEAGKLPSAQGGRDHEIAIIGMAGRYPGAKSLGEFWTNLTEGTDCISEIPSDRWDAKSSLDSLACQFGKPCSKWGGFLDEVDMFDPLFFNISPREAAYMDPQERLFLEVAWQAVEDAGHTSRSMTREDSERTGVFVGVMYGEYQLYPGLSNGLSVSGSFSSIANRVSYALNLTGPSMAVDTMCSSSLTAIHLACDSLRSGSCETAIAGGVNLSLHPSK
jgi:amino acid adenylation domain-containing protein